jgi:hypothetical protein
VGHDSTARRGEICDVLLSIAFSKSIRPPGFVGDHPAHCGTYDCAQRHKRMEMSNIFLGEIPSITRPRSVTIT